MGEHTMKAFALASFEEPADVREVPIPPVGTGEIRVRVRAASINGFDAFAAAGFLKDMMEHRFPVTIGKDFAGVVEEAGEGVSDVTIGDEVIGITPYEQFLERGTFAEHVVVASEGFLQPKPSRLDFGEGAALGLAGLAAQVSIEAVDPSEGDRVLVAGATGGVGAYAVQLAATRGATVIATGLPDDESWLRDLGAAETIDYSGDVAAVLRERHPDGVEALIDLVNRGEDFEKMAGVVRDGGRIATTLGAADVEALAARRITATNVMAQADPAAFARLVAAAAEGTLTVPIAQTFALADVAEGLEFFRSGRARGKVVVTMVSGR